MTPELMHKLWRMAQEDSVYLVYIDDGKRTNFARIMKSDKYELYYYQFMHDDETTVRKLDELDISRVAVFKLDKEWMK